MQMKNGVYRIVRLLLLYVSIYTRNHIEVNSKPNCTRKTTVGFIADWMKLKTGTGLAVYIHR